MLNKIIEMLSALIMAAVFILLLLIAYLLVGDAFDKSYDNHDRMIENHKVSLEYDR